MKDFALFADSGPIPGDGSGNRLSETCENAQKACFATAVGAGYVQPLTFWELKIEALKQDAFASLASELGNGEHIALFYNIIPNLPL